MKSEKDGHEEIGRVEELKEGDNVPTPNADISKVKMPPWFDSEKFERAKKVYKEHFAGVNFSHLCGLLLGFYFTKIIKPLQSTGESETKNSLFHRYLQTVRHIQKWYEGNIFDPNDSAHRSLSMVRGMHARVGKKMAVLNDGIVYLSQWDMAVTQWSFVGPLVLFKNRVGLHGCNDKDYDALIHFWRSIGFLLGIEDKYNLCDGDYPQVLVACEGLLHKEIKGRVAVAHSESVNMGKNVSAAFNMIIPLITWNFMTTYIHKLVNIPCPDTMGFFDYIANYMMLFLMIYAVQISTIRRMVNGIFRWRLDWADEMDLKLRSVNQVNKTGG